MTPPRLLVFDLDGTLIDSQLFILEAMRRGFRKAGLPAPRDEDTLSIVGLSLTEAVRRMVPDLPDARVEEVAAFYKAAFWDLRAEMGGEKNSPLYPGAREALTRLSAAENTLLAIATGKARRGLDHVLAAHELAHFFANTQTSDLHPSKPHPAMLEACLAETGAEAGRAVMIGDTEFDMEMGRAAGFRTVGVSWGYHPVARLRAAGADLVIDHFDALDAALARLGLHP